ncbi:MAG TPA: hypothetical protein VFU40_10210 [Gemmatimonadales bacterium]|nr:hypothetical protein [Gemmatimonadales bacterium]
MARETPMLKWIGLTVVAMAVAWIPPGPSSQPAATPAVIEDKAYRVTPAWVVVKTGIIAGDVTDMKVTERVEPGSGRGVSPAQLTGTLKLKNTSVNQTVLLVMGKLLYVDAQGQPIQLDEARTEPTVRFAMCGNERLDPGQDATHSLDVEFPADALKRLRAIRLELAYIPSPYRKETVTFTVSIGQASRPARWGPVESPPIQAESFDNAFIP